MSPAELVADCTAFDGVAPVNEAARLNLASGAQARIFIERPAALALAFDDAPVELAVHPEHRGRGLGRELIAQVAAAGEKQLWAHGDLPAARALADTLGARAMRTLLVLVRGVEDIEVAPAPNSIAIRTATPADIDQIVAVNAAAFADHPEQGAMDREDFGRRAEEPWFDWNGLFVAVRDDAIVGFHWTKLEDDVGEVYVVGVDPSLHRTGLGTALTSTGIEHLITAGAATIELYVEADNLAALSVYQRMGFKRHASDVLYALP